MDSKRYPSDQTGQAVIEYILLLFIVVGLFLLVMSLIRGWDFAGKITAPVKDGFARAYRYGHPKAKGYDEPGGPEKHPRADGGNNFRLYINPR